jgi:hypothetical protein
MSMKPLHAPMHSQAHEGTKTGGTALLLLATLLGAACGDDEPRPRDCDTPDAQVITDPVTGDDAGTPPNGDDSGMIDPPVGDDGGTPDDDGGTPDAGPIDDGGFPLAPPLRNPVLMQDLPLAKKALGIMGSAAVGAEGSCRTCHAISRPTLSKWRSQTREVSGYCLQNTSLSDQESIDDIFACFGEFASEFDQPIEQTRASQLGIYSAAAHLPWFKFAFKHGSSTKDDFEKLHQKFVATAGMPRSGEPLKQADFDVVAEWFERGLPKMRELVPSDSANVTCTPEIKPQLKTHVDDMKTKGWLAHHRQNALPMFGCKPTDTALTCLSDLPRAKDQPYGKTWDVVPGSELRLLFDNTASLSTFWSRSSADGRYISSALSTGRENGAGAQIVDLQRMATIDVFAGVDPGYFPDNSGFVFQGSEEGALVCDQTVLAGNPAQVLGTEAQCGSFDSELIGIYEQLAKSVGGSDYWVAAGIFESDDGGFYPTLENPQATFDSESSVTLTPMLNQGNKFEAGTPTTVSTPNEGDPVLSPSGTLLITRAKGKEVESDDDDDFGEGGFVALQNGYRLHRVTTTQGKDGLSAELSPVATVCLEGGKPMLSFDERWMVIHHYITPGDAKELGFSDENDPKFAPYKELGGANLYLVDLTRGAATRITNVAPGQYALFPHFRADNWIYFVVRTTAGGFEDEPEQHEYFVASDAALRLESKASN